MNSYYKRVSELSFVLNELFKTEMEEHIQDNFSIQICNINF